MGWSIHHGRDGKYRYKNLETNEKSRNTTFHPTLHFLVLIVTLGLENSTQTCHWLVDNQSAASSEPLIIEIFRALKHRYSKILVKFILSKSVNRSSEKNVILTKKGSQ